MEKTRAAGDFTNVVISQVDWSAVDHDFEADLVLLSDVNYDPTCFGALSATLHRFLTSGKKILLGSPQRLVAKTFLLPFMDRCLYRYSSEADGHAVSVFVLA